MEIVRLPPGEQAPFDVDCIRIEEEPDARYKLTASAMCVGDDDGQSVSIVGGPHYGSQAEAENAGIAWATTVGVERLFVSLGTLDTHLKLTEIDLPL